MRWFVFQPRTVTAPDLGSAAMLNTLFYPACPTCLSRFWIFLYSLLCPNVPPSVFVCLCSTSLSPPSPNCSPRTVLRPPGRCPHHPPTRFHRSSLRLAPHACACCRSLTPFATLGLHPGTCKPLGVHLSQPLPRLCVLICLLIRYHRITYYY